MRSAVHEVIDLLVWQTCRDCYRSDDTIAGFASVSSNGASSVINLEVSNYMIPYTLPAVAADAVTSSLSVMTRTASMRKPLFASNRCLRSKLFTNSRVAFPIAPAMLLASTFIVRPSEPRPTTLLQGLRDHQHPTVKVAHYPVPASLQFSEVPWYNG